MPARGRPRFDHPRRHSPAKGTARRYVLLAALSPAGVSRRDGLGRQTTNLSDVIAALEREYGYAFRRGFRPDGTKCFRLVSKGPRFRGGREWPVRARYEAMVAARSAHGQEVRDGQQA
jgi:hypothetical protein